MKYRARFSESGGYDCLSDAIVIEEDVENIAYAHAIAVIDLADFGQPSCRPCPPRGRELADLFAAALVKGLDDSGLHIDPALWGKLETYRRLRP